MDAILDWKFGRDGALAVCLIFCCFNCHLLLVHHCWLHLVALLNFITYRMPRFSPVCDMTVNFRFSSDTLVDFASIYFISGGGGE